MNKLLLETEKRRVIELLDTQSYRPIDKIIRWSTSESHPHFIKKCVISRAIVEGFPPEFLVAKIPAYVPIKLKSWATPLVITEARFSSRLRTDILVVSIEGTFAIEIAETESEASIKKKRRAYNNMEIELIEIRI